MRYVELSAGALGLLAALAPLLAQLRYSLAGPAAGPPAPMARLLVLLLVALPWLGALAGLALGLTKNRGTAPLLAGTGGLAAGLLGPAGADLFWPSLLLAVASILRLRRNPLHPMGVIGSFSAGFVLAALGYITLILLSLGAPVPQG